MKKQKYIVRLLDDLEELHNSSNQRALWLADNSQRMHYWEFHVRGAMFFKSIEDAELAADGEHHFIPFTRKDEVCVCDESGLPVKKLAFDYSIKRRAYCDPEIDGEEEEPSEAIIVEAKIA